MAPDAEAIRQGATALWRSCTESQKEMIVRRYHGLQSRIRLDEHRMASVQLSAVVNQVSLRDADLLTQRVAEKRGLIILTSHYGRLGMLGPAVRRLGLVAGILTATADERATGLSPMQRWVGYRNSQSTVRFTGGPWIMVDDPATRLRAVLRRGGALIVAMDAFSSRSPARDMFRFGDGTLAIPTGVVRLAKATGAAMAFALMHDLGGERAEMRCWDLAGPPALAVQQAFDLLNQAVQAEPWQWHLLPLVPALLRPDGAGASAAETEYAQRGGM
jgi:lauroyl/myristoyl acyltransferase